MKRGIKIICFVLVIMSLISIYFISKKTNTAYETVVDNEVNLDIATWKIEIDEQDIATATSDISIKNITWENEHSEPNKAAPGSKGIVRIKIDPTDTQVAVEYNIKYFDHLLDPNCLLTVTSIDLEGEDLTKVEDNLYHGYIPLDEIQNGAEKYLVIHVEWQNNEDENNQDTNIGKGDTEAHYLKLEFSAHQYTGN